MYGTDNDPYFDTQEWKDWNYKANGFEARDQRLAAEEEAKQAKILDIAKRQEAMDASRAAELPGYDPASGMTVSEYNAWYDNKFPYGDPGEYIPSPRLTDPVGQPSPIIANQDNLKSNPGVVSIPLNPNMDNRQMRSTYHNGGRFLPYVGNSWWQTSEPLLPWNRKDWRKPGNRWYNTGE